MAKQDEQDEHGDGLKQPAQPNAPQSESGRSVRMITAKDSGWITPTAFVAPITLVPIDPPQPLNRRRTDRE